MRSRDVSLKEYVIQQTKSTGILPCIKLHQKDDYIAYAQAMYDGGARVIEVTMTTPGVLEAIEAISGHFGDKLLVAAGTVLDPTSAREVILHGGSIIVNPCVIDDVIDMAARYNVPVFSGAFTATEVFNAMRKGATMVKIFPGALGGPKYMTNLKMVFPDVNLIPSGGITPENAGEFIRCGACAVSGARTFMDFDKIEKEGLSSITRQVQKFIEIIREAKKDLPVIP
ncbi:MAG: bifunctional 4-hydroxy-2-oxoglutarate aldolase/2-dehydro-3-deoxy-phosphogluconate aldolase [Clostridia bacterium]|nr:bifunctional 4-hydroxy-2-oxoglutarate aldolase/2-dehydro-3-deoxy-phosphogluconate aldolase [Clostridia bacterium]MBQ3927537.1 bifunctional 4-hydroxy-2-oxoglutarate aldolase/2-dehydro-3-deoxy-phosphogluconate aldolase [Clostridia bacterium]MBQ7728183.1 bifunctional 4-hydroxy-2-oxoglutarate aldolase/2-dehydro-3-deoxy-phosphogluconate aldolase [Clostridia bacterium]